MEYQKMIPLDDTMNQNSKIRATNWVEIYDQLEGKHDNSNIKFKMSMTFKCHLKCQIYAIIVMYI